MFSNSLQINIADIVTVKLTLIDAVILIILTKDERVCLIDAKVPAYAETWTWIESVRVVFVGRRKLC